MTAPVRPQHAPLEQRVEIETPEHVAFSYTIAGIGSRAAAALIDFVIVAAAMMVIWFAFGIIVDTLRDIGLLGGAAATAGSWAMAVMYVLGFALFWGYSVFFEALADGQTPGKRILGLRVVQDGGYSISFAASAVRNFIRILDAQPGFLYVFGTLVAIFSRTTKRIGDHVAGTIVVHERAPEFAPVAASPSAPADGGMPAPVTALLTDDEFDLLSRFLERRQALEPAKRAELTAQIAARFAGRLPEGAPNDSARLVRLFRAEQEARARGVASRGAKGAAREQHVLVARNAARWAEFAALLARAQRGGIRSLGEQEIADFVSRYREAAADLARLRTASAGRESEAQYYLSRLVASGHNILYRRRELALRTVATFLVVTLPREVRRSWRPILASAALLLAPAFITYASVRNTPALALELLHPGMIDRVENAARNEGRGRGYVAADEIERPIVAGFIMTNNIQVTLTAFAAGATAGIGTVLILLLNGLSMGAAVAAYANHGVAHLILGFVVAHGVLELSAIFIGAGGGLLIARGILLPGDLPRRDAVIVNGRRAVRLATVAIILLVFAGIIEGLFSVDPFWSLPHRVAVGVGSGLVMMLWLSRGWRGEADVAPEHYAYVGAGAPAGAHSGTGSR